MPAVLGSWSSSKNDQTRDLIRSVFDAEAEAVRRLAVTDELVAATVMLAEGGAKVVVSGVGKAGLVGRRFAATLSSQSRPGVFLHPTEALHGDLGVVADNDPLVLLSNSGKTEELIRLADSVTNPLVVVTGDGDSPLSSRANVVVEYGRVTEACPLGFTPSVSMAVMGAVCDALALGVGLRLGITRERYAELHHGGYLGQKARGEES